MPLPESPRCVITGAGGGFGRELATQLGQRRAHLVLADRDLTTAEAAAELARRAGASSARAVTCDVTKAAELEKLAEEASAEGPVDLLINNAGVATGGLVGELSLADWHWTIDVDLLGVIYGCHAFVPRFRQQGRGRILNVASAAGLLCAPRMGAYNVAKAGVVALSETLASELVGTEVRVTVVCPTFFKTNIVTSGHFTDTATQKMADRFMERATEVEPVARAALAAVDRGDLYCVPHVDGRWLWRLKRMIPSTYRHLSGLAGRHLARRAEG